MKKGYLKHYKTKIGTMVIDYYPSKEENKMGYKIRKSKRYPGHYIVSHNGADEGMFNTKVNAEKYMRNLKKFNALKRTLHRSR